MGQDTRHINLDMATYSDFDSDGYSSDEDADYVPSEDNLSEDDMSECVKEEGLEGGAEGGANIPTKGKRKKKGLDLSVRKRKKGGLKLEDEEKDGGVEEQKEEGEGESLSFWPRPGKQGNEEEKKKKKADDLWASFLSDVGPKASTPAENHTPTPTGQTPPPQVKQPIAAAGQARESTVTITKVFDFAGEEVRVTKEVDVDSKEARIFLKAKEEQRAPSSSLPPLPASSSLPPLPASSSLQPPPASTLEPPSASSLQPPPASRLTPGPSARRSAAGMGSILGRLGGKKQKMSTLEKSKMDWDAFKSEEGITDELAIHNRGKEGYVERKCFLERVDHRQFELEKQVRLTNMKR